MHTWLCVRLCARGVFCAFARLLERDEEEAPVVRDAGAHEPLGVRRLGEYEHVLILGRPQPMVEELKIRSGGAGHNRVSQPSETLAAGSQRAMGCRSIGLH